MVLDTVELEDGRVISPAWRPNGRHQDAFIPMQLADEIVADAAVTSQAVTGADTILDALGLLPPGLGTYSSYVDNFGGFSRLLTMRQALNPNAVYFSYTIFGNRAHFADVEPGAMSAGSFARWLANGMGIPLAGNSVPGMYTSAGNADAVFAAAGENIPHDQLPTRFIYESAHYGAGPHICHPSVCGFRAAHGTQWTDTGPNGENYDRELWLPGVLGGQSQPVLITIPEDPDMITSTCDTNTGLLHVFVFVPHQKDDSTKGGTVFELYQSDQHSWAGGEPGKQKALAFRLAAIPENVG